jgi:ribonuclease J
VRQAIDDSLARSAEEQVREIDLLQDHLYDDVAEFVYERLRRRPMVLPVVWKSETLRSSRRGAV